MTRLNKLFLCIWMVLMVTLANGQSRGTAESMAVRLKATDMGLWVSQYGTIEEEHAPYHLKIVTLDFASQEALKKDHPEVRIEKLQKDASGRWIIPSGDALLEPNPAAYALAGSWLGSQQIEMKRSLDALGWWWVEIPSSMSWEEFDAKISASGLFERVMRDCIVTAEQHTSNDPLFASSWHISQTNDKDIDADDAWNVMPSSSSVVNVAILDGHGFDTTHPDLAGQWADTFNAVDNNTSVAIGSTYERHATACAGIPGAIYNNAIGTPGLGYNLIRIQAIKVGYNVTTSGTFSTSDAIQAAGINRAISYSATAAISMSYGSSAYQSGFFNAITSARTTARGGKGMPVFGSTGNSGSSTWTNYPASYSGVIAVGSTTSSDFRSSFSNYGGSITLSAPGSAIQTTDIVGANGYSTGDYYSFSGTSAATPVAASIGALAISCNNALTEVQVKQLLAQGCEKVGGYTYSSSSSATLSTWSSELGYGRVNMKSTIDAAMALLPVLPDVTISAASASATSVLVGQSINITATQAITSPNASSTAIPLEMRWSTDNIWSADDAVIGTATSNLGTSSAQEVEGINYVIPAGLGTRYILIRADANGVINESNESNNVFSITMNVSSLPDLTITSLAASNTSPFIGNSINISCTYNGNSVNAPLTAYMQYRYSTDAVWSSDDIVIGNDTASFSSTVSASNESISFTIPSGSGMRYILAMADNTSSISESNENNNLVSLAINTSVAPLPDVSVSNIVTGSTNVLTGQSVTTNFTVNLAYGSSTSTTISTELRWSSDSIWSASDAVLGSAVSALSASIVSENESQTFTVPSNTGTMYLLIQTDNGNAIAESNETNLYIVKFIVSPLPDITLSGFTTNTSNPYIGQVIQISCNQLLNASGAPSSAVSPVLEYRYSTDQVWSTNDIVIGMDTSSISASTLSNAENISFQIPNSSGTGTRYILARADATSLVAESNESNNTFSLSINVTQADVTVSGVSTSTASVVAGQTITASCIQTMLNASSLSSQVQLEFRWSTDNVFDPSDALLGTYVSNLTSALNYENEIVTFSAPQTAGTYYLMAKGDANNNISQEVSETNNTSSIAITVTLQPDVIVANLATNTQNPFVGQTIAISCNQQITNPGSATVNSIVEYRYSSDNIWSSNDVLIGYDTSAFNPSNLNFAETINFTIPSGSGNFFILAKSDATSLITEANESNNTSSVALTIGQADITVTQTSISSSYVTVGQALTLTCVQSLINGSSLAVSPAVEVRWSSDQVWSPATDNLIGTGTSSLTSSIASETETFNTTAPTAAGTYYLLFRGDVNNIIQESNESNDVVVTVVVNNLPDLTLTSLNAGTSNPYVGQTLNVSCNQVISNGSSSTVTAILQYRLSTDAIWSSDDVVIGYDTSYVNSTTTSQAENIAFTVPNVSGTRYILARADALAQISESNEGNNTVAITLTIATADVSIANSGAASFTASTAQNITVNIVQSMTNPSSLPTAITAQARWSTNNTWESASDALLATATSNLSTALSSKTESLVCTIPSVAAGNYFILVQTDALDVVTTESSTTNNLLIIPVTVVVLPDFSVANLSVNTANPFIGQTITITANQTTSSATSSMNPRMEYRYSADNLWSSDDIIIGQDTSTITATVLSEAESINYVIPSFTGTRYILAQADAPGLIAESNESNNTSVTAITIASADITITQANTSVNQMTINQSFTCSFNQAMLNASTLPATVTAELRWSSDNAWSSNDTYIGQAISTLSTNTASELEGMSIVAPSTPGTYYLLIQGDVNNQIIESSEVNNLTVLTITVTALPDYTITGLSSSNSMPNAGQTITISCAQNQTGGTSLLNAVRMQYRYSTDAIWSSDDIIIGADTSSISSSTSSNSESITYTIPTGNGTRYILAMADAFSQWNESNENNNNVSITLNVGAANLPDVTLTSIAATVTTVNTGQSVTVTCNQVISAAPTATTVSNIEYRWSADQVWASTDLLVGTSTSTFSSTVLSESESITFNVPNTPGTYYLLLMADASNVINESNENNVFSITYTVTAPTALPDIYISGAAASATTVVPGQLIDVSCNQFTSLPNMALDTIFLQYRWNTLPTATGSTLFGSDWSDLGGGDASDPENQNYTIPAGTGQRYIIIICDWNSGVVESDETNNVIIIPITVNAGMVEDPNQELESKSLVPAEPKALELHVYPNPATDVLNVIWPADSENLQPIFTILDMSGRMINAPLERRKDGVFIDLDSFSNGSYILMVQDRNQAATQRFIVAK